MPFSCFFRQTKYPQNKIQIDLESLSPTVGQNFKFNLSFSVYVDVNTAGGAMAATININTAGEVGNRFWKILVQRIACDSPDL